MSSEFTEVHRRRSQKSYVKVDSLDQDPELEDGGEEVREQQQDVVTSLHQTATRRRSSQEQRGQRRRSGATYKKITTKSSSEELTDADIIDEDDAAAVTAAPADTLSIADYYSVLRRYPYFRAYLISHLCQHIGDWFVRIASLLVVEELGKPDDLGGSLAKLVLAHKLIQPVVAPLGGFLADRYDRRHLMIMLDLISGVVVLGYLLALQYKSLHILYTVTVVRSAVGAIYYPITTGIVPCLCLFDEI